MSTEEKKRTDAPEKSGADDDSFQPKKMAWFVAIFQADFPMQMEVFRWLTKDPQYKCIWIMHDKDVYDEPYLRTMPDGSKKQYNKGDIKPAHYHMIVHTPLNTYSQTMSKRFGNYVTFLECRDRVNYAYYLIHATFDSRDKYHYSPEDVSGDLEIYQKLTKSFDEPCVMCREWADALAACEMDGAEAIRFLCIMNRNDVVKFVMAHAYFCEKFFNMKGK